MSHFETAQKIRILCFIVLLIGISEYCFSAPRDCKSTFFQLSAENRAVINKLYAEKRIQEAIWELRRLHQNYEANELEKKLLDYLQRAPVRIGSRDETALNSEVYVVWVGDGMKAIFKPRFEFWQKKNALLYNSTRPDAEATVFELAKEMNLPVPTTVIRKVNGMVGSLQVFIHYGELHPWIAKTDHSQGDRVKNATRLFDFLIDHQDRIMPYGIKNIVEYNVGLSFSYALIDNSSALGEPNQTLGRFKADLNDIKIDDPSTAEFIHNLQHNLTEAKMREIILRRHSQEVANKHVAIRNNILTWYEKEKAKR